MIKEGQAPPIYLRNKFEIQLHPLKLGYRLVQHPAILSTTMTGVRRYRSMFVALCFSFFFAALSTLPLSATSEGNFSLQVSPSPLVATLKPGESKELELKIRNASTGTEELKIEARSFRFDSVTGEVKLNDTAPSEVSDWISFSDPVFTIKPGAWFTQKVRINLPHDTGFSYSFALVINRTSQPKSNTAGQQLRGSVAVFTLINVDRPGATRGLDLTSLTTSQRIYEYLPVTVDIKLKNTGNTIVQPYGNLFINRGGDTTNTPATTLPVNGNQSYLLPGTERTLSATWSDGFPLYKTTTDNVGKSRTSLSWNWENLTHFRFGRYTARVVAVYNDGVRDVPIEKEVVFWVIPWKAMLLFVGSIVAIVLLLRFYIKKRTDKAVARALAKQKKES